MQALDAILDALPYKRTVSLLPWERQVGPPPKPIPQGYRVGDIHPLYLLHNGTITKVNEGQSKAHSWYEAWVNVFVGIGVSLAANWTIMPLLGYHLTLMNNIYLTAFFTAVSLVRSYFLRRLFNRIQLKESV